MRGQRHGEREYSKCISLYLRKAILLRISSFSGHVAMSADFLCRGGDAIWFRGDMQVTGNRIIVERTYYDI